MSLVLVTLTLFAVILIVAHSQNPVTIGLSIAGLAAALYWLNGPAKVAAPLIAILSLALSESVAGLRSR